MRLTRGNAPRPWLSGCFAAMLTAMGVACAQDKPPESGSSTNEWRLQLGTLTHHFKETQAAGHKWQDVHPGLGLELKLAGLPLQAAASAASPWRTRYGAGVVKDSRDFWGGYAGLGITHHIADTPLGSLEGGLAAAAVYRSNSWSGDRDWSFGVLPMLTLVEPRSGIGLDLILKPRVGSGQDKPATLILQFSVRVKP